MTKLIMYKTSFITLILSLFGSAINAFVFNNIQPRHRRFVVHTTQVHTCVFTNSPDSALKGLAEQNLAAEGSRREALERMGSFLKGMVALSPSVAALPSIASALDIDAFVEGELAADKKACNPKYDPKCAPELTKDEALCQYGQSGGRDRAEACKRVREAKAAKK
mmetsp:Transcript_5609/g.11217  ORF Transcript_5609/g.11217 Transcript_5609/m.11217 type:complete len:165 (+) Transcript_5609:85-579(+)